MLVRPVTMIMMMIPQKSDSQAPRRDPSLDDMIIRIIWHGYIIARSNSLGFPKPAGPRPETRLAGYKLNPVIQRLFPSNVATMLLRPTAPPRRGRAARKFIRL